VGRRLETITVGPLGLEFHNLNSAMKLKGHRHYGTVEVTFQTLAEVGFPAFRDTVEPMEAAIQEATAAPFRDPGTNEQVAQAMFDLFDGWAHESCLKYNAPGAIRGDTSRLTADGEVACFRLLAIRLGVMGVRDKIGHNPGMTYYTVSRDPL